MERSPSVTTIHQPVTKRKAARWLKPSRRTLNNLLPTGHAPTAKIGASVRFSRADLAAFIESQRKGAQ